MSQATKRITAELGQMRKEAVDGVDVQVSDDNIFKWQGSIQGPPNSPYSGGKFKYTLTYPDNFPFKAPTFQFNTKVYHPNFDKDGNICIGLLKAESWKPTTRVSQIFQAIRQLLAEPNPDDPLDAAIADVYKNKRDEFNATAKDHVRKYAK